MREHFEQTREWFRQALFEDAPIELHPAREWTDDAWFLDQDDRHPQPNAGWWPLRPGRATGRIVGGNLCTLNLLQGTPWMPSLEDALLVIEDDFESQPHAFVRNLTSLLQLPDAAGVRGLVIGRFQTASGMSRQLLEQIIDRVDRLRGLPVLANIDYAAPVP